MFFLVRSAVCIGVVAMMLPDTGPRRLNDLLAGVRSAAPGQARALLDRVQRKSGLGAADTFDLSRMAVALAPGAARGTVTGSRHPPSSLATMTRQAANQSPAPATDGRSRPREWQTGLPLGQRTQQRG